MFVNWKTKSGAEVQIDIRPTLALGAGKNATGGAYPSGSAILVSDRLALCARHVLTNYWEKAHYGPIPEGETVPNFQMLAAGGFGAARTCQWDVEKFWTRADTDVAVLAVAPREGEARGWTYPVVDLAPPTVGETVIACGFTDSSAEETTLNGSPAFIWKDKPTVSRGVVTAVWPQKRDDGFLTFPCFEFDGRVDPGMSGGPIFNEDGRLCGVVASGEGNDVDGYRSAGALLWAAMAIDLDGADLGEPAGKYPLLRMAIEGKISAVGLERVRRELREDGGIRNLVLIRRTSD
jgi:V8-like Glu-specific endopeptidase